jgi:hypothetical protein
MDAVAGPVEAVSSLLAVVEGVLVAFAAVALGTAVVALAAEDVLVALTAAAVGLPLAARAGSPLRLLGAQADRIEAQSANTRTGASILFLNETASVIRDFLPTNRVRCSR